MHGPWFLDGAVLQGGRGVDGRAGVLEVQAEGRLRAGARAVSVLEDGQAQGDVAMRVWHEAEFDMPRGAGCTGARAKQGQGLLLTDPVPQSAAAVSRSAAPVPAVNLVRRDKGPGSPTPSYQPAAGWPRRRLSFGLGATVRGLRMLLPLQAPAAVCGRVTADLDVTGCVRPRIGADGAPAPESHRMTARKDVCAEATRLACSPAMAPVGAILPSRPTDATRTAVTAWRDTRYVAAPLAAWKDRHGQRAGERVPCYQAVRLSPPRRRWPGSGSACASDGVVLRRVPDGEEGCLAPLTDRARHSTCGDSRERLALFGICRARAVACGSVILPQLRRAERPSGARRRFAHGFGCDTEETHAPGTLISDLARNKEP